jgi:competence protein ComEC
VAEGKDHRLVALSLRAAALVDDCARARIVVSAVPVRRPCRGPELVLDRFDVARDGATALTFGVDGISVETVAAERGKRPWSVRDGR